MPPPIDDVRTYKPFIDGLRAIAILTVVFSHVDMPGLGGGYVGVDIFFVISGYLIITQIRADIDGGHFSLFDFYARRAFRILPAFLLVMVAVLLLVSTVFVPFENKEFSESFFLSTIMLANHHYLAHQGYFDTSAFAKSFLHMWSLAVEEQFYLVTPLILLGVTFAAAKTKAENGRRLWVLTTVGLAVLSFAACVAFTFPQGRPNVSFYIMPTRGWEFILGGIVPSLVPMLRKWPAWVSGCLTLAGAAAIGLAVAFLDADTLYPSYRAAFPALGATFILAGGLANPNVSVARALATWPMVRIGLVSYAWYLWHWPLISIVKSLNYGARDYTGESIAVALSLVLAVVTYRFVELPVRRFRRSHAYRAVAVVAGAVVSCVMVAGIGYFWAARVAPQFLPVLTGLDPIVASSTEYPAVRHRGILLGDSHADVIQQPFLEFARRAGADLTVLFKPGCPPLLQVGLQSELGEPLPHCDPFFEQIRFDGAEFVIIVARWNSYVGLPATNAFDHSVRLTGKDARPDPLDPYEVLKTGLIATIEAAKHANVRRILVLGQVPEFPWYPPHCVTRAIRVGIDGCVISRAVLEAKRQRTMDIVRNVASGSESVRFIDPTDLFCTATQCRPHEDRQVFYFDPNHLSPAGAERLYKGHERDFLWALTGNETPGAPGSPAAQDAPAR